MKHCSQCDTSKPVEAFNKCKSKKDGLSSWCSACNRTYAKVYSKRNRDKAVRFTNRVKTKFGCLKCGITQDYLIQFHHIESDQKEAGIAHLTQRTSGKPSFTKIKNEMRKCMTLCANHHIEFHHLEKALGITIWEYLGMKDNCEIPTCKGGGTPGNENVIDGKVVCDYCHAEMMEK